MPQFSRGENHKKSKTYLSRIHPPVFKTIQLILMIHFFLSSKLLTRSMNFLSDLEKFESEKSEIQSNLTSQVEKEKNKIRKIYGMLLF